MLQSIKNEFKGWNLLDWSWLFIANAVILGLGLYWGDSAWSLLSSVTGVTCVIFVSKQMISNYYFGIINVVIYAILAFQVRLYGDFMLNMFYYLPMNIKGFYMWKKAANEDDGEVVCKRLNTFQRFWGSIVCIILIAVYSVILNLIGGNIPLIDSTSTVLSVIAMYLLVKQYMEQWYLWVVVNVVSIIMWVITLKEGTGDMATLLMWIVFLLNSLYGLYNWKKKSSN